MNQGSAKKTTTNELLNELKNILFHGVTATQKTIALELTKKGHTINQSKISRLLRKINAVKSKNEHGEMVYCLPHDVTPPSISAFLGELVLNIDSNEFMIIIKTSPGSASLIARIIDKKKYHILGTIAGDDTIFVAPQKVKNIPAIKQLICNELGFTPTQDT